MHSIFYVCLIVIIVLASKNIFGGHFNPISVYTTIWISSFYLYLERLILYESIESRTILFIVINLFAFILGALTIWLGQVISVRKLKHHSISQARKPNPVLSESIEKSRNKIALIIVVFTVLALLGNLLNWHNLLSELGSFSGIFAHGHVIKQEKIGREAILNYMQFLAYPAAMLSSLYLNFINKKNLLCYIPLLSIVLFGFTIFGRAPIVVGIFIYLFGFALCSIYKKRFSRRTLGGIVLVVILSFSASNLILDLRTAKVPSAYLPYADKRFKEIMQKVPSVLGSEKSLIAAYHYLASPIAAFNANVRDFDGGSYFGMASFSSIFRFFDKFGIVDSEVLDSLDRRAVQRVPVRAMMATYLTEVWLDFGSIGIFLIPYLVGALSSLLYLKYQNRPTLTLYSANVFAFVFISTTLFLNVFRWTLWTTVLGITIIVSIYLDKLSKKRSKKEYFRKIVKNGSRYR